MNRPARETVVGSAALALVLTTVVLHLLDIVATDGSTVALVVIAIVIAVLLWMPDVLAGVLGGIEKIRVGQFEVAIRETKRAVRVSGDLPAGEADEGVTGSEQSTAGGVAVPQLGDKVPVLPRAVSGTAALDILHVEAVARKRLRFIRAALLPVSPDYDPRSVLAELQRQRLLNDDETIVLLNILNWDVAAWPPEQRERFLDAAWPLASRLAAQVWDRQVRKTLAAARWVISDFEQKPDHRPDFLAFRGGKSMIAAARVGDNPEHLKPARRRLSGDIPVEGARRVVIIPDRMNKPEDTQWSNVVVVRMSELL